MDKTHAINEHLFIPLIAINLLLFLSCSGRLVTNIVSDSLIQNIEANADTDEDGVHNATDNCIEVENADQSDIDIDGAGDACDADDDNDTILDDVDNCYDTTNVEQTDTDSDGIGDACDDEDVDNILDVEDNCIGVANEDQDDADSDGIGDACEEDDDNDGIPDEFDIYPTIYNLLEIPSKQDDEDFIIDVMGSMQDYDSDDECEIGQIDFHFKQIYGATNYLIEKFAYLLVPNDETWGEPDIASDDFEINKKDGTTETLVDDYYLNKTEVTIFDIEVGETLDDYDMP